MRNTNVIRSVANRTTALPQRSEFTRTNRLRHCLFPLVAVRYLWMVSEQHVAGYRNHSILYITRNRIPSLGGRNRTSKRAEPLIPRWIACIKIWRCWQWGAGRGLGDILRGKRGVYHWLKLNIYDRTGCLAIRNSFLDVHHFVYGLCGNVSSCVVTHQRLLRWPRDRCLYEPAKITL